MSKFENRDPVGPWRLGPNLRDVLHDAWLRMHVARFDPIGPDSFYSGIRKAESVLAEVAAEHGIDWRELREP